LAGTSLILVVQFSQVVGEWLENQILIPDWIYFYCPGATLLTRQCIVKIDEEQQKIIIVRTNDNQIYAVSVNQFSPSPGTTLASQPKSNNQANQFFATPSFCSKVRKWDGDSVVGMMMMMMLSIKVIYTKGIPLTTEWNVNVQ